MNAVRHGSRQRRGPRAVWGYRRDAAPRRAHLDLDHLLWAEQAFGREYVARRIDVRQRRQRKPPV